VNKNAADVPLQTWQLQLDSEAHVMNTVFSAIIADDEANARESMRLVAERYTPPPYRIDVKAVVDSLEVLRVVLEGQVPDILFLDIRMETQNSLDWLERYVPDRTEVILVSAYDDYTLRALRLSVFDYLVKPVDTDAYAAAISRFAARRAEQEPALDRLAWTSVVAASLPDRQAVIQTMQSIPAVFTARCVQQFPALTNQELRMLHLQKAGFLQKDAARILGIEPESVKKIRQRLNKKTGGAFRSDDES
jgi:two-component system LytT family response regulator